jgi:hypothetical protein
MVNLRDEMDKILDDYGNDVLLIRSDKNTSCKCIDRISLAPNDKCPICLGTGYIHSAERIRVRTRATSSADTLPKVVSATQIGDVGVSMRQFYADYTVRPKKQDLLVMCEWDGAKPVFDEYTEIYTINNSEPLRGDNGRIEYFQLMGQSNPVNMKIKLNSIHQNVDKLTYYIATR